MHNGPGLINGLHKSVIHPVVSVSGTPGVVLSTTWGWMKHFHRGEKEWTPSGSGSLRPRLALKFLEKSVSKLVFPRTQFHKMDIPPKKVSTQVYLERGELNKFKSLFYWKTPESLNVLAFIVNLLGEDMVVIFSKHIWPFISSWSSVWGNILYSEKCLTFNWIQLWEYSLCFKRLLTLCCRSLLWMLVDGGWHIKMEEGKTAYRQAPSDVSVHWHLQPAEFLTCASLGF